jgi:CRP/FNR family transcriptional regulator, cyclic AMP receptor protein
MNQPETGTETRGRLEMQLGELGIPPKFVDEIIGHHTLVNYNKGSMIFLQGSPADLLFWVFTGLVKVYCPRPDGTRIMVKLAGPGDLIGHVDYIDDRGRRAQVFEVEALTKCSVALFTRDHVIKLLQSFDHAGLLQMIERLNTLWSSMAQWFGAFLGMSFRERLEVVLHELGAKFGVREKRGILLTPELSHADLADMIGSSRPMVSRLIADMTEENLLLRQGKKFILLERFAGGESDSANHVKDRRDSFPERALPTVGRPLFNSHGGEKIGPPAQVAAVVPAASRRHPKAQRI